MYHVGVLRVGVGNEVLCELNNPLVVLDYRDAWQSKMWQHKAPYLPQKKKTSLTMSTIAAVYSGSVVEGVTHFCVRENTEHTVPHTLPAPLIPRVYMPPYSRSLHLSSANTCRSTPPVAPRSKVVPEKYFSRTTGRLGPPSSEQVLMRRIPNYCTHCVGFVWPSLGSQPHQRSYQLSK